LHVCPLQYFSRTLPATRFKPGLLADKLSEVQISYFYLCLSLCQYLWIIKFLEWAYRKKWGIIKIIVFKKSNYLFFFSFLFISFCLLFFSFHFLHISLFRFVFVDFVLLSLVSFDFVFISLISFRFVFVDFVSFLFRLALYRCPQNTCHIHRGNPSCMSVRYTTPHIHYLQLNSSRVCLPKNFQKFKYHIFICVFVCVTILKFLECAYRKKRIGAGRSRKSRT
jgi:hypothetical protein